MWPQGVRTAWSVWAVRFSNATQYAVRLGNQQKLRTRGFLLLPFASLFSHDPTRLPLESCGDRPSVPPPLHARLAFADAVSTTPPR